MKVKAMFPLLLPLAAHASAPQRNMHGSALQPCSTPGMPLTGYLQTGSCDAGTAHICVAMHEDASAKDYCAVRGQQDWCKTKDHWCVCQWAFADYVRKAGCDHTQPVVCNATSVETYRAYVEHAPTNPDVAAALACLEKRCGKPSTVNAMGSVPAGAHTRARPLHGPASRLGARAPDPPAPCTPGNGTVCCGKLPSKITGIYHDYTANGSTAGVGSASYGICAHPPGIFPGPPQAGNETCGDPDSKGAVLMAIDVRTGNVTTQIASVNQWFNPAANYTGDAHIHLPDAKTFASHRGKYPSKGGEPIPPGAARSHHILFTIETREEGHGRPGDYLGLYAIASADGHMLGNNGPASVYPLHWGNTKRHTNVAHCHAAGEEVYERMPTYGANISFDNDDVFVWGAKREFDGGVWLGEVGCGYGAKCLGFEFEGRKGWLRATVDESGLVLRDYYWDKPEVALFKCVDDAVCMPSTAAGAMPKHLCEKTCHRPPPPPAGDFDGIEFLAADAVEFLAADAVDVTPVSLEPTPRRSSNSSWKAFAQEWGKPWCRENCTQITTQAECEVAAQYLKLGNKSSTNVVSAALPSCMLAAPAEPYMGLRWNKYGLSDVNMTTRDWLGFVAICQCAPQQLYKCVDEAVCLPATGPNATTKDACEKTCHPPPPPSFMTAVLELPTSPAAAPPPPKSQVRYPVVGPGGTHKDFTAKGTKAGIGSASYDYWISSGPWGRPPDCGRGCDADPDGEGAVLLALDVMTGEITTEIASRDQYFNASGEYKGGGHTSLGSPAAFAKAGGLFPSKEHAPLHANATANFSHTIFFTTELRPRADPDPASIDFELGLYATTAPTSSGRLLGDSNESFAGLRTFSPRFLTPNELVGSNGSFHNDGLGVYLGVLTWGGVAWEGQIGKAGVHGLGFEFDGQPGWLTLVVSGDRAGLILKEYYWAGGQALYTCVDDAVCVVTKPGPNATTLDKCKAQCHPPAPIIA